MKWIAIIILSTVSCIIYGIAQHQITVRICIEYFTAMSYPQIVPTNDLTILALVWGVAIAWPGGVILGIPLAISAQIGPHPKKTARELIQPLARLLFYNAILAMSAGIIVYITMFNNQNRLIDGIEESVPYEKHVPYTVNLWVNGVSVIGFFIGGIILVVWVYRSRQSRVKREQNTYNVQNQITRAHLKNACDTQNWDLLDKLLETSNQHVNDNALYTDDWGEWWGMLFQCVYHNYEDGVRVLLKHGADKNIGSWGDGIPKTPLEVATDTNKLAIMALLKSKERPTYTRKSDPLLPEIKVAKDHAINCQGEVRDSTGMVFQTDAFEEN